MVGFRNLTSYKRRESIRIRIETIIRVATRLKLIFIKEENPLE